MARSERRHPKPPPSCPSVFPSFSSYPALAVPHVSQRGHTICRHSGGPHRKWFTWILSPRGVDNFTTSCGAFLIVGCLLIKPELSPHHISSHLQAVTRTLATPNRSQAFHWNASSDDHAPPSPPSSWRRWSAPLHVRNTRMCIRGRSWRSRPAWPRRAFKCGSPIAELDCASTRVAPARVCRPWTAAGRAVWVASALPPAVQRHHSALDLWAPWLATVPPPAPRPVEPVAWARVHTIIHTQRRHMLRARTVRRLLRQRRIITRRWAATSWCRVRRSTDSPADSRSMDTLAVRTTIIKVSIHCCSLSLSSNLTLSLSLCDSQTTPSWPSMTSPS